MFVRSINIAAAFLFLLLFLSVWLNNFIDPLNPLLVLLSAFFMGCCLMAFVSLSSRCIQPYWRLDVVAHLGLFVILLVIGGELAVGLAWDTKALFDGARDLALEGRLVSNPDYFYQFPHNLGGAFYLAIFFDVAVFFGVNDFYLTGVIVNACSISLTYYLCFDAIRRLFGVAEARATAFFLFTTLPVLVYVPVFYTDTLSMPFIASAFWLYSFCRPHTTLKSQIYLGLLTGLLVAIGAEIKFTSVIILIAISLSIYLSTARNYAMPFVIMAIGTVVLSIFIMSASLKIAYFDSDKLERTSLPYTHWVMMGLNGRGGYNGADYELTKSVSGHRARHDLSVEEIGARLRHYGLLGYVRFLYGKQLVNFGNGEFDVHSMLDDSPQKQSFLHAYVLSDGRFFHQYKLLAQGHYVLMLGLLSLGLIVSSLFPSKRDESLFSLRLSMLGIFIFLGIWEASGRYMINYIPVIAMLAAASFAHIHGSAKGIIAWMKEA